MVSEDGSDDDPSNSDADASDDDAPFADVIKDLRERPDRGDEDGAFAELRRMVSETADTDTESNDPWTELRSLVGDGRAPLRDLSSEIANRRSTTKPDTQITKEGRLFPASLPFDVLVEHGIVTILLFGIGGLVYALAMLGILPKQFWLIGLPFVLLGIIESLPVLAWVWGVWNPQRV